MLGEECPRAKPHPDPYLRALELVETAAEEALIIEDSPAGLRAAVAAGVPAVGITTGQPRAALVEAGACVLIDSFHDLLAIAREHEAAAASGDGNGNGAAAGVAAVEAARASRPAT